MYERWTIEAFLDECLETGDVKDIYSKWSFKSQDQNQHSLVSAFLEVLESKEIHSLDDALGRA